jgi:peptide deformylase
MIRPIITPSNPILRKRAIKVMDFGASFQTLVDDMIETMLDAPGVGLAAPQVAVSQRVVVIRLPDSTEEDRKEYGQHAGVVYVLANPKIIKASKAMVSGVEGCLSLPGLLGEVERHQSVVVTAQDRHGKDIRLKADDWFARVIQHELDHLDGILYTDRTDDVWRTDKKDGDVSEEEAS